MSDTNQDAEREAFVSLIREGEKVRETKDPRKAIPIFLEALVAAGKNRDRKVEALCHLSLCHYHLKNYEQAMTILETALKLAEGLADTVHLARVYRHMSAVLLMQKNFNRAYQLAVSAFQAVQKAQNKPNDTCWFVHQIIKVLLFHPASSNFVLDQKQARTEAKIWLKVEEDYIDYMWHREKNPIAKWVWYTGYLSDACLIYPAKAIIYLPQIIAISIVKKLHLRLAHFWHIVTNLTKKPR